MKAVRTIIFAKAPVAGFAKTRLIPALGAEGSAALAGRLLRFALAEAVAARLGPVELCVTPDADDPAWAGLGLRAAGLVWSNQGDGDLGQRMARAASRGLSQGTPVLLIGTDCPQLDRHHLNLAGAALEETDAVLTPACDGGYVLLGLSRFCPSLFTDMPWSTNLVEAETVRRIAALEWRLTRFDSLPDVDEPSDLEWLPAGFGAV